MAIEFVESSGGSGLPSASVARPSGIQDGDVMLALHVASSSVPPAGWSAAGVTPPFSGVVSAALHSKVVTDAGSEPASYSFANGSGGNNWVLIAAYRGVDTSSIFDTPFDYYQDGGASSVLLPSISTTTNNALFLVVDAVASTFASRNPQVTGMTIDTVDATNRARAFLSEIRPVSGPTGARTLTRETGSSCGGILAALRPASGAPPAPTARPWTEAFVVE